MEMEIRKLDDDALIWIFRFNQSFVAQLKLWESRFKDYTFSFSPRSKERTLDNGKLKGRLFQVTSGKGFHKKWSIYGRKKMAFVVADSIENLILIGLGWLPTLIMKELLQRKEEIKIRVFDVERTFSQFLTLLQKE